MKNGDNILKGLQDQAVEKIKGILLSGKLKLVQVKAREVSHARVPGNVIVDEVMFSYEQESGDALPNYVRELLTEMIRMDLRNWSFNHKTSNGINTMTAIPEQQTPKVKIKMVNYLSAKKLGMVGSRSKDWFYEF